MKRLNPKTHDSLFKWLITSFTREFFAHYFPAVRIGEYSFLDKEFLKKYEALQESLKGDLFLLMEVEIDGEFQEVAIQIEHQSEREEVAKRLFEYLCYVWLLKQKPVWSIVIYTDEAQWRKPVMNHFCYGFSSEHPQQHFHFDVIKINREKSSQLIKKHSLLCKLLALKANDEGTSPERLVSKIYQAVAQMKDQLTADQLLLITQWVDFYKKVPDPVLKQIKQEVNMELVETTISEHVYNQGKAEGLAEGLTKGQTEGLAKGQTEGLAKGKAEGLAKGKAEGLAKGKAEGLLEGQLAALDSLHQQGMLSKAQRNAMAAPLRQQLRKLQKSA